MSSRLCLLACEFGSVCVCVSACFSRSTLRAWWGRDNFHTFENSKMTKKEWEIKTYYFISYLFISLSLFKKPSLFIIDYFICWGFFKKANIKTGSKIDYSASWNKLQSQHSHINLGRVFCNTLSVENVHTRKCVNVLCECFSTFSGFVSFSTSSEEEHESIC